MNHILPTLAHVRAWQVGERWYYSENEELAPAESSRARLVELDGELVLCVQVSGTYGVNVWGAERVGSRR